MEEQNPYIAPAAELGHAVLSAAPLSLMDMLFSYDGRIRRGQYWGYVLACWLATMVALFAVVFLFGAVLGAESARIASMLVGGPVYLAFLWICSALQAKRWHDRDKSAWWMLLTLVPLLNLWAAVEIGFFAGTPGRNSYGPPPP